jgi:predicted DNA-binding antitoxin AbrB/MazE fold protein
MTHFIQAIYEHGVFRPLQPVEVADHKQVSLVVTEADAAPIIPDVATSEADLLRQRHALAALRTKMDSLPSHAPDDGLGGADHDLILYGWQK